MICASSTFHSGAKPYVCTGCTKQNHCRYGKWYADYVRLRMKAVKPL